MNTKNLYECEYLTVADIRKHLNISQAAAYQLVHRKDFPVCRIGGSIRIPTRPFLVWVNQRTHIPNNISSALTA